MVYASPTSNIFLFIGTTLDYERLIVEGLFGETLRGWVANRELGDVEGDGLRLKKAFFCRKPMIFVLLLYILLL